MDSQVKIEEAISLLESVVKDVERPPAMIVLPPDVGFILGNPGGFIHLAISSLRSAQGQEQSFKDKPWVGQSDWDWILAGLKPDADAHTYLPKKKSKLRMRLQELVKYSLFLLFLFVMGAGIVSIYRFVFL